MWIVLVALVVLFILFVLARTWREGRSLRALGEPRLEIAPGRHALGDRVSCRLSATVKSRIRIEQATFALTCCEYVQWTETERDIGGHGEERKIARRAHEEVWVADRRVLVGRDLRSGEVLDLEAEFDLPLDGPPTFIAAHNQIRWRVGFSASVANGPEARVSTGFEVPPSRRVPGREAKG